MNSNSVTVSPVQTKADQNAFIKFAWGHYRGDPNWIPPIRMNIRELLNYRPHPFYDNAEIQTFLAKKNGVMVGRIAAIVDRAHNQYHDEQRGMFGFFESVDDQTTANALFDTARKWFADRGITKLRGPCQSVPELRMGPAG